ncbi:hypothetical protein BaRGS_00021719 [Batillaria attramentaria]|uniref:Secreted protein n=1 Tax=Batillaria attramentaria TaxID=370345 RepID=A0ABD0KIQ1_9CAEN
MADKPLASCGQLCWLCMCYCFGHWKKYRPKPRTIPVRPPPSPPPPLTFRKRCSFHGPDFLNYSEVPLVGSAVGSNSSQSHLCTSLAAVRENFAHVTSACPGIPKPCHDCLCQSNRLNLAVRVPRPTERVWYRVGIRNQTAATATAGSDKLESDRSICFPCMSSL